MGWTINGSWRNEEAPGFRGRLVVQDGIKTLPGVVLDNLTIEGQLTYSPRLGSNMKFINQSDFTVRRCTDYVPKNPDRYIDVRIQKNEIERIN